MKHFLTYTLIVILASLCSKGEIPTPPEPEPPVPGAVVPKIVMNIDKNDCILAESFPETSYLFEVKNANKNTTVEVVEADGVDTDVVLSSDHMSGTLKVKANAQFGDGSFLVLRAMRDGKSDEARIDFERAYAKVSSVGEGFAFDAQRNELTCDMKAVENVILMLDSNVELYLSIDEKTNWFDARLSPDGEQPSALLSVMFNMATDQERTTSFRLLDDKYHQELLTLNVRQGRDADRYTKERNALIALWKSLNGHNWLPNGYNSPADGDYYQSVEFWNTDMPLRQWLGVELWYDGIYHSDKDLTPEEDIKKGHVRALTISFGEYGTLPEEIGDLIFLEEIRMGWQPGCYNPITREFEEIGENYIVSPLPKRLGELTQLRVLDLHGHRFEEDLESSPIKDLVRNAKYLRDLDICDNNFTGSCPEWLGDMARYSLPEWLGYQNYSFFYIYGNRLSGKVPDNVKSHPCWTHNVWDHINNKWVELGEEQMKQQEGYGLWE